MHKIPEQASISVTKIEHGFIVQPAESFTQIVEAGDITLMSTDAPLGDIN
ncbi:hypothetical protein ABRP72_19485 [Pectobacterium carotovorum]